MRGFQIASHLTSMRPLVDGGMSVSFHTRELPSEEKVAIINHLNRAGWLLFKEDESPYAYNEAPEENANIDLKSPSQRLRSILFVFYKEKNIQKPFQQFYDEQMEKFIARVKKELDEAKN